MKQTDRFEIEKLRGRVKRLEKLIMTDITTGLKNKRQFQKDFENQVYWQSEEYKKDGIELFLETLKSS